MTPLIIDAHLHTGEPGGFFAPLTTAEQLLALMDRLGIGAAVCTDHRSIYEGCAETLPGLREAYTASGGRLYYLGVFHPGRAEACLAALTEARSWPGFAGIKLHPSFHRTPAEDPAYAPAWRWAATEDRPVLTHSWSASSYNPVQELATPARFERYVQEFPQVRLVLGHAGGRGEGRAEAVRMAAAYPQVFLDLAGDIFCYRLLETLLESVPPEKVLFASDYPWLDPRAGLTRVLLSEMDDEVKRQILGENARRVYRLEVGDADD